MESDATPKLTASRTHDLVGVRKAERDEQEPWLVHVPVVAIDDVDLGSVVLEPPPEPVGRHRAAGSSTEDHDLLLRHVGLLVRVHAKLGSGAAIRHRWALGTRVRTTTRLSSCPQRRSAAVRMSSVAARATIRARQEVSDEPQAALGGVRHWTGTRDRAVRLVVAVEGKRGRADAQQLRADHAAESGEDDRLLLQRCLRATRSGHADAERAERREVPGVHEGIRRYAGRRREADPDPRAGAAHDAGAGAGADAGAAAGDGRDAAEPAGDAARFRRPDGNDATERRHLQPGPGRAEALPAARQEV